MTLTPVSTAAAEALSTSQSHGTVFETLILGTKGLVRSTGSTIFDAPFGAFEDGCGLNIKATGANHIELADATRVFMLHRLLEDLVEEGDDKPAVLFVIGRWRQEGRRKVIHEIWEIRLDITDPEVRRKLFGAITSEDIRALHMGLSAELRPDVADARAFAYKRVRELNARGGLIRLNPKIQTTKNQRRLQCSISIPDLVSATTSELDHHCYTGTYRGLELPLVIEGGPRKFSEKKQAELDQKAAERERLNEEKKRLAIERDLKRQAEKAEESERKAKAKELRRLESEQKKQVLKDLAKAQKTLAKLQARMARNAAADAAACLPAGSPGAGLVSPTVAGLPLPDSETGCASVPETLVAGA